jgi:hypothetical protein
MSVRDQSRHYDRAPIISGLPLMTRHLRMSDGTPQKCHEPTHAPQQLPALFDPLAGAQQERLRYREADRLGGFEIHE